MSGSRAYGTNLPHSDTDLKGVFVLPEDQFFGLHYVSQIANDTNDEVFYELRRFVELLLKNNPTVLELLGTPADCIVYQHPLFAQFQAPDFLSKLCRQSFAEYAVAQIRKAQGLNKKINHPEPPARKAVLDFCYVTVGAGAQPVATWLARQDLAAEACGLAKVPHLIDLYALFVDPGPARPLGYRGLVRDPATSQDVQLSAVPKGEEPAAYLLSTALAIACIAAPTANTGSGWPSATRSAMKTPCNTVKITTPKTCCTSFGCCKWPRKLPAPASSRCAAPTASFYCKSGGASLPTPSWSPRPKN